MTASVKLVGALRRSGLGRLVLALVRRGGGRFVAAAAGPNRQFPNVAA